MCSNRIELIKLCYHETKAEHRFSMVFHGHYLYNSHLLTTCSHLFITQFFHCGKIVQEVYIFIASVEN